MKTSDVANWSESDWQKKVAYAMPSGGGAVGVIFVWVGRPPTHPIKVGTSSFVLKPSQGSAAPTKFAEFLLSKIGGASSPHSKGIRHTQGQSKGAGKWVEDMLRRFKGKETDQGLVQRWAQVWPHYQGAGCYLIQETQTGVREFGDEYRTLWGLSTMLANGKLMHNLGRLFVADAMIGNGDRLCAPNTGNIMFKSGGKIAAIDSNTVLTNYQECLKLDEGHNAWCDNVVSKSLRTPTNWGLGITKMKTDGITSGGRAMPSFEMVVLFEPAKWWENVFKSHLIDGLRKANMSEQEPLDWEWDNAWDHFKRGLDVAEKELDKRLSGISWLFLKMNFKRTISKHGADPNLDWTNFKVRRLYYRARRSGKSEQQALDEVSTYVTRKLA